MKIVELKTEENTENNSCHAKKDLRERRPSRDFLIGLKTIARLAEPVNVIRNAFIQMQNNFWRILSTVRIIRRNGEQ